MSVYLVKKDDKSPWVLTDDGSTNFECHATGLFDEKDLPLKAWQKLSSNIRSYFIHSKIHFNSKDGSYYLAFSHLKDLDDRLHQYVQMMIELINGAELVTEQRSLFNRAHRKSEHQFRHRKK